MFGQQKTMGFGSGFGAATTGTSSSFGTSTPFGQTFGTTPAPATGGLFGGGNTSNNGSLFGQTSTASTFGTTTKPFNFGGTPATAVVPFGQPQPQTPGGLFAVPQASVSPFGAKTTGFGNFGGAATSTATSLFGQTPAPAGGMLFGQAGTAGFSNAAPAGTTVKFNPVNGQDTMMKSGTSTSINTRHQCITAMKPYENKSLDELRYEDYASNRKGVQQQQAGALFPAATSSALNTGFAFGGQQQQQAVTGFSGFGGTSTATPGLFGQQQPAPAGGLFAQNKPLFGGMNTATTASTTGFGFGGTSQATGLFGQQQQAKPLFGTATSQPSLFGATTSTAPATAFNFGAGATPGTFGAQPQQAGGLFGSKPAGFGAAPTTSATGFFGATTGGLFGSKPATTGAFGFGTNTSTAGFGATTGTTGLFGAKPTGFGTATTTLGAGAGNFSFNTPVQATGGLFGGTQSKPASFGFNLAGGALPGTTGFASGLGAGTTSFTLGGSTSTLGTTTNPAMGNQQLQQQQLLALTTPYGDSPLFWNLNMNSEKREQMLKPTNPSAQKAALSSAGQYVVSPRPTAKIKPKSLHSLMNGSKSQLFEGLEDEDFSFGNDSFMPRRSVKKLTLRKGSSGFNMSRNSSQTDEHPELASFTHELTTPKPKPITRALHDDLERAAYSPDTEPVLRIKNLSESPISNANNKSPKDSLDDTITALNPLRKAPLSRDTSADLSRSRDDQENYSSNNPEPEEFVPHATGIVLTRPGYYTNPILDDLIELIDENGDCFVDDFTVGRENYGSLFFPGSTNVANLNLDEIVHFRRREVVVYPDDEKKPALGEGLNKPAEVTLDCVWPRDKSTRSPIKEMSRLVSMKYQDKIEQSTAKIGAKFIDYRPETGSWVFLVKHFSKYGLLDDSDEEEVSESDKKKLKLSQQQQLQIQKLKTAQEAATKQKKPLGQGDMDLETMSKEGLGGKTPEKEGYESIYPSLDEFDDDSEMPDISSEKYPEHMFEDTDELKAQLPLSHRLASSLGVNAQNMQVMKASFFADDDYHVDLKGDYATGKSLWKHQEKSAPSLFSPSLTAKYMTPMKSPQVSTPEVQKIPSGLFSEVKQRMQKFSHPALTEHTLLASGLTDRDTPRKIVGSRVRREICSVAESLMYKKHDMLIDSGCFMGRSFRVGWGPGWTLVHSGKPINQADTDENPQAPFSLLPGLQTGHPTRQGSKVWTVTCQKVDVADFLTGNDKTVISTHEEMLKVQLEHSRIDLEDGSPLFVPAVGVEALHQYAELGEKLNKENEKHPDSSCVEHMRIVWNLCVVLWGNLPELRNSDADVYEVNQARREALSKWLTETAEAKIKEEVNDATFKNQGHLPSILSYMSGNRIPEACSLAQASGDHRLALSLTQAVGSHVSRQLLAKQMQEWSDVGTNKFIDKVRLKIYSLLSGQLVWTSPTTPVNTCDHMDWKRALALHMWYHCKPNAVIAEALAEYEKAYKGRTSLKKYANPPLPPYLENDDTYSEQEQAEDEDKADHVVRDTCYHLLKLYCQKSHRLDRLLNPTTSTSNQLDYRLTWHLYHILQSLAYRHLSPYRATCLHSSFASQLEALGLWHWAIFVLLHIEDAQRRESSARSVLERHVSLSTNAKYKVKEDFVRERLRVPEAWIHHAQAMVARSQGKHDDEAWHLLKARQWNDGHTVVLKHIAADSIINDNFDYLLPYLEVLSPPDISRTVLNWDTCGKVFLDYINLCKQLELLKKGEPSGYDLEKLQPQVVSLCNCVGSLVCSNSKERLCQSEMAMKSTNLLRSLLKLQDRSSATGHPPSSLLAPLVTSLPMPEDYLLHQLRELTRSHLLEMTL